MSRNPSSAVGQKNARGRERQGHGGLAGTWGMEKEGAKTRATHPASRDTHTLHWVPITSCFSSPAGHNPTHFGRTTIANIPTQYVVPMSGGDVGAAAVADAAGSAQTWCSLQSQNRDGST